jgi:hypothetical protein
MVWETGDQTTKSSVHTLTEAGAIEKCWAAIGKKAPIVVNYELLPHTCVGSQAAPDWLNG